MNTCGEMNQPLHYMEVGGEILALADLFPSKQSTVPTRYEDGQASELV
jgi:hypothetical protein